MGSHAALSHHMHRLCAHLKFHIHAAGAHHRGVQRLVAIDFRNSNVVFELAGHGLVELMEHA